MMTRDGMTRRARKNNGHIQAHSHNLCDNPHFAHCYLFNDWRIRCIWMDGAFVCCGSSFCSLLGINVWLVVWFPARRKPCRVNRFQGTLAGYLTNNSTLSLICLFVICLFSYLLFRLFLFRIYCFAQGAWIAWRTRQGSNLRPED